MKIVVMTTGTNNTLPLYSSLSDLGNVISVLTYDEIKREEQRSIPWLVAKAKPDAVVYIGAIEEHHGKPVPSVDILGAIGAERPLIHICCDGAEPYWWLQLDRYYDRGRFALQVNIDGTRTGPIGDRGMTTIPPTDLSKFENRPWDQRSRLCGFSGGIHAGRPDVLFPLEKMGLLDRRPRDEVGSYEDYLRYLGSFRAGINAARTGGCVGGLHVKYRASGELPGAGCLVIETAGSPLSEWFVPGVDYVEYGTVEEAATRIRWARDEPIAAEAMALRMRAKVAEEHSPAIFWGQVFDRAGLGAAPSLPLRETKHYPWFHAPLPRMGESPSGGEFRAPKLVDAMGAVNIVAFKKKFFAIPHRLGDTRLERGEDKKAGVVEFDSVEAARSAISAGKVA